MKEALDHLYFNDPTLVTTNRLLVVFSYTIAGANPEKVSWKKHQLWTPPGSS